jgi:hypothetical protein
MRQEVSLADTDNTKLGPRPNSKARTKGPYYKASLVLAVVFMALALSLPLWLDLVRQPVDRGVLGRDMKPIPGEQPQPLPGAGNASSPAQAGAQPPSATQPGTTINANCRAYVFARCNALHIESSDCLPIALKAMRVPVETGLTACRAAVQPDIDEAGRLAATRDATPEASNDDERREPVGRGTGNPAAGTPADIDQRKDDAVQRPAPESLQKKVSDEPVAQAATQDRKELSPAQRAQKLETILGRIEELQYGVNNYATVPAAQNARLAEIRALVEEVGTAEAESIYKQVAGKIRFKAPPMPDPGNPYRESPRVEAGMSAPTTSRSTPEMDKVRSMANDARRQAGMPEVPPPDPDSALRSRSPSEAAAQPSIEQRP